MECALPIESGAAVGAAAGNEDTESAIRDPYSELISDPMIAVPSEPPTWRVTSFIAEATPDFSGGTEPMTDSVDGPMTQPMLSAPKKNHRPSGQYGMSYFQVSADSRMLPSPNSPAMTILVVPKRFTSLMLEVGPITRPKASGTIAAPAWNGE